jgi:hypothetical protein
VEEKFIMGEIKKELYDKYTTRYEGEMHLLSAELGKAAINSSNLEKAVEKCLQIA